jgi:hypothetical protein
MIGARVKSRRDPELPTWQGLSQPQLTFVIVFVFVFSKTHPPTSLFPLTTARLSSFLPLSLSNVPSLRPSPSLAHVSLSPVSLTSAKDPSPRFGGIGRVRSQHDGGFAPARFCSNDTNGLAPALSQQLLSTGDSLSLHRSCFSLTQQLRLSLNSFCPPPAMLSDRRAMENQ